MERMKKDLCVHKSGTRIQIIAIFHATYGTFSGSSRLNARMREEVPTIIGGREGKSRRAIKERRRGLRCLTQREKGERAFIT